MSLRLAVLKSVFNSYNRYAFPLISFFAVLIYFFVKNKKEQRNLLIYEIFGILLLVTPFIGNKIVTLGAGNEANWPLYGILCIAPLLGYAMVDVLQSTNRKKERIVLLVCLLLAVQMSFGLNVTGEGFALPGKYQKLSKTAIALADTVDVTKEPYVMAPKEVASDIREYNHEIRVFYNESYSGLQKDLKLLQSEADFYGCNYIILNAEYDNEEVMTAGGYGERTCIEKYVIYTKSSD